MVKEVVSPFNALDDTSISGSSALLSDSGAGIVGSAIGSSAGTGTGDRSSVGLTTQTSDVGSDSSTRDVNDSGNASGDVTAVEKKTNNIINKELGIALLLTVLLFTFIGTFVNFYSSVSSKYSSDTNYQKLFYILGGIIGMIIISYGILQSLNVFDHKKPENFMSRITSYVVISLIMLLFGFSGYSLFVKKENLTSMSSDMKILYEQKNKYAYLFALYVFSISTLYAFNPYGVMTKYGGPVMFFSLFVGLVMFSMAMVYYYYLNNASSLNIETIPGLSFFLKPLYILFSAAISGGLIYFLLDKIGVLEQDEPKDAGGWLKMIVNTLVLVGMLSILYKLMNVGGYLESSPLFRLIVNVVLYIPCLFLGLFSKTAKSTQKSNPSELGFLLLTLGLFMGYFGLQYFYPKGKKMYDKWKLGGKHVTTEALPLNNASNIAGYQELNGDDKFEYTYGLSFWFYVDSLPPNTNASYTKMTNILSYGGKPTIKYNSKTNSLFVFMKSKNEDILVHEENDVMLQKWNNVIINYNGGTLDVFYNGKLVKSVNNIVPYMNYDMLTVGSENGIYGGIKNLIYYKKPLTSIEIQNINSMQKS
jgi:hypothetical protein